MAAKGHNMRDKLHQQNPLFQKEAEDVIAFQGSRSFFGFSVSVDDCDIYLM